MGSIKKPSVLSRKECGGRGAIYSKDHDSNLLGSVNRDHFYQGIDMYSLANRALRFTEQYNPSILQVEADGNDAVLTIYHGDEETYGDFESLELYRLPFATRNEYDLLEVIKKIENTQVM